MIIVPEWTNDPDDPDRHLIVISAPRRRHPKYWRHFDAIIDFDVRLAQAIIGHDNAIVLASREELPVLRGKLPDDVLLEANLKDIWIRDFAPILTTRMVQFAYRPRYLKRWEAAEASDSFAGFCHRYGLQFERSKLILDGGNLVSNHKDMAVVTERVLCDNPDWTRDEIIAELKARLALEHVVIIPEEPREATGHADGMALWVDEHTLAVARLPKHTDAALHREVEHSLPGTRIVSADCRGVIAHARRRIGTAYGLTVNGVTTPSTIYLPAFGAASDPAVLRVASLGGARRLVAVDAAAICHLGGTVRCLSWSVIGEPAAQLIQATRLSRGT
jgi:agmatine/peptidylarginine deiminase